MSLLDTNYQDQRLTPSQKKKIKPAIQGGGYNYLGKQEEVTVPKKWLSDPDHVVAELAYITPREKKILLDIDLYGSLDGKPNNAPGGLDSLQGDMGTISRSSGGGTGNTTGGGGGGNNDYTGADYGFVASQPPPAPPAPTGGDQEDDVAQMMTNMGISSINAPTGYSGDSGVDAYESGQGGLLGTSDYQGTIFTGGTYGTDGTQGSRTISFGDDAATEDLGRPDITYYQPTGTALGDYKSSYELNQIKYIQDQKLNTVKSKLQKAGFDIDDDANFQQTIDYVNNLSSDELATSYKDLKNPDGTPFYDPETIAEFERTGYIPKGGSMTIPGLGGAILNKMDKPLTKDELLFSLNEAEEVGKTGGGAMDWQERMKTYSPNQYATMTGMDYNPRSGEFTMRTGGNEQDAFTRIASPYELTQTVPQESMVSNYFANLGMNQGSPLSSNLQTDYNNAKNSINSILGILPPSQQFGYSADPYGGLMASNLTTNPFNIDYLRRLGLI